MSQVTPLHRMSNEALLEEAARLAACEREATVRLIAAIVEIDARRLYLAEGCGSMAAYCRRVLRLSEHDAFKRIKAARLAGRFPIILERLSEGALTLSNLKLVGPHLTSENCEDVLDAVAYKSKHEAEMVAAALRPQLASPQSYRLQLSISREAWDQLQKVKDLLRYSIHDGDPSRIFERAIPLLLADVEKTKFARTDRPRAPKPSTAGPEYVPAYLKRFVSARDGDRCAFVGPQGRCDATCGLEFHHRIPSAVGGPATPENIELRCRAHNQHESEAFFGRQASAWRKRGSPTRPGASEAPAAPPSAEDPARKDEAAAGPTVTATERSPEPIPGPGPGVAVGGQRPNAEPDEGGASSP